jgi:hypothetical protein
MFILSTAEGWCSPFYRGREAVAEGNDLCLMAYAIDGRGRIKERG